MTYMIYSIPRIISTVDMIIYKVYWYILYIQDECILQTTKDIGSNRI